MSATVVSHEWVENFNMDVAVARHVGLVRGVAVEVWASKARDAIALVVTPTVKGFTILAVGGRDEMDTFARVGTCVLAAMAGVLPLVVGDLFRDPRP